MCKEFDIVPLQLDAPTDRDMQSFGVFRGWVSLDYHEGKAVSTQGCHGAGRRPPFYLL